MPEIYQIEPSYDDLAFEPEITWKEFKCWCKNLGILAEANYICWNGLYFWKDGSVISDAGEYDRSLAQKRTYKQMQELIKILYKEN